MSFNSKRLSLARKRRRLTGKGLAEAAGLSSVTISRIENGENEPDDTTVAQLASVLNYPVKYFFLDDPDELDTTAVSFRSLSKMTAKEREAAIGAGRHCLELSNWLENEFSLPEANLIDLSYEADPESAARTLRSYWGLGEKPIGNMLKRVAFIRPHILRL